MKGKHRKEIKGKTIDELKTLLKESKDALFSLHMERVQAKLKNTKSLHTKRKDIARIATYLREKEVQSENI